MRQHQADKNTWSILFLSLEFRRKDAECLEAFCKLREIATNRPLGRYPREAIIDGRNNLFSPLIQHDTQDDIIQACDKLFQDLDSPYIKQGEMKAWYNRLIDDGVLAGCSHSTSATANSLLLTLLPTVERISIRTGQLSAEMSNTIRTISTVNRDAPLFMKNRLSLTKLLELDLYSYDRCSNANGATGVLEAFMTLPSLRALRLEGLGPLYEMNHFLYCTPPSNLTEIKCFHCSLSATQLARLLDHMECLQVFSYAQYTILSDGAIVKDTTPAALLGVVFQYAKTSLTYLNYYTDPILQLIEVRFGGDADRIGSVGSFRGYEALKVLSLSCVLLFEDGKEEVPKRLINELPTSLEKLEILDEIDPKNVQLMFAGMLEMKRERLPNLGHVAFESTPFDEATIKAYERVGLILHCRTVDDTDT